MSAKQGLIRPHSFLLIQCNRLVDVLCIVACLYLVCFFRSSWPQYVDWLAMGAGLVFMVVAQKNHLYRSWRVAPLHDELSIVWHCWVTTVLIVVFALFFLGTQLAMPRMLLMQWFLLTPAILTVSRTMVRLLLRMGRRYGRNFRTAAIVGKNDSGHRIASRIMYGRWMGIRLLGYFDERCPQGDRLNSDGPLPLIGDFNALLEKVRASEIDIVYISLPMRAEDRIKKLIDQLSDSMVSIYYVADFSGFDFLHAKWETIGEVPVLRVIDSPFNGFNGFAKRFQDICLSLVSIAIALVPMAIIAVAIRLTSPGPAIYRQVRHGLDGREFVIYKFRTMTVQASNTKAQQATKNDARVTPLGAFLRRTSLDELPQLFNVLQGRMSMVGPRPHPLNLNEEYSALIERFILRHKVRPGITGWAQINGFRGETETVDKMRDRIKLDLEYIDNWSFWFDLKILMLTLNRVWRDRNAY